MHYLLISTLLLTFSLSYYSLYHLCTFSSLHQYFLTFTYLHDSHLKMYNSTSRHGKKKSNLKYTKIEPNNQNYSLWIERVQHKATSTWGTGDGSCKWPSWASHEIIYNIISNWHLISGQRTPVASSNYLPGSPV